MEIINSRGDNEEEIGRLQSLSGKALTKEIANLQKQQEKLFSGSPPYLKTISEYLEHFQWPLLESISTSLGNQETLSNSLVQMEKSENSIDQNQTPDYFTKTQQPILENISRSFEGMLNLQIKEGRFSEEKQRESEGKDKFGFLKDILGKKPKKKDKGIMGIFDDMLGMFKLGGKGGFSGILMGAIGKIFPKVAGMANPITALGLGLLWAVIDGFKGWAKAEDWGVSKISGAIGGFFGGTADGGIKNAFMQSGKWALIGAGIGSFVPVVGTLIGGLIGAAIGGLLGWIGGEKIAKAMDAVGKWFKDTWNTSVEFLKETWIKFSDWIGGIWDGISGWFKEKWNALKEAPGKAADSIKEGWNTTVTNAKEGMGALSDKASSMWESIKEKISSPIDAVKEKWTLMVDNVWDSITGWFTGIWDKIKGFFTLDKLLYLTPIAIPKLLFDLWNAIKGHIVGFIPDWIPGAKEMAMKALGVEKTDVAGTTGTTPTAGQTAYQSGTENNALATGTSGSTVVAPTTVMSNTNVAQSSNIFTPPNSYDPMMQQMNPGFQY